MQSLLNSEMLIEIVSTSNIVSESEVVSMRIFPGKKNSTAQLDY